MICVDIDNVARWAFSQGKPLDLECLLPPFEATTFVFNEIFAVTRAIDIRNLKADVRGRYYDEFNKNQGSSASLNQDTSFVVYIDARLTRTRQKLLLASIQLDGMGYQSGDFWMGCADELAEAVNDEQYEELRHYCDSVVSIIFFAISLMHCKNVELRDKRYSRQVLRQAERKGKELIKYKELVIEPFKKQVRAEAAESGESEIHRALHICRGHFATYSEERPLFGKYTGTFWKPMHVRGSKGYGEVRKSYKVDVE